MKLYLCHRYTGKRLKDIGTYFGIGESGVSQASRRVAREFDHDSDPRKRFKQVENRLGLSKG
jgi:chromosomal replication initiation ATPase DnaA